MSKIRNIMKYAMVAAIAVLVGCGFAAVAEKPDYQQAMEDQSGRVADAMTRAEPFPETAMKDSLERKQLSERLQRFNKPNKIGYLYVFEMGSREPVGYYVVRGKISSVQSQMLNPTQTWNHKCSSSQGACAYLGSAESIGDDGSFGPNEGGDRGIFFFDAKGALHETVQDWHYSDAPIEVWKDAPNLGS
jgi:hypothetical protein